MLGFNKTIFFPISHVKSYITPFVEALLQEQDCFFLMSNMKPFKISFLTYSHLYINLACLFVCLSVCLYPTNVKTAEPIGPKFFVGHLGTPGMVYEKSKFQIFVSIKIRSSLNF